MITVRTNTPKCICVCSVLFSFSSMCFPEHACQFLQRPHIRGPSDFSHRKLFYELLHPVNILLHTKYLHPSSADDRRGPARARWRFEEDSDTGQGLCRSSPFPLIQHLFLDDECFELSLRNVVPYLGCSITTLARRSRLTRYPRFGISAQSSHWQDCP